MVISATTGVQPRHLGKQTKALGIVNVLSQINKLVMIDTCHIVRRYLDQTKQVNFIRRG